MPKKTNIYNEAFSKVKSAIEIKLTKILNFKRAMKVHLAMEVTFIKTVVIDEHVEITEETKPIKLLPTTFTSEREIRKGVQAMRTKLEYKLDNFLLEGTEWKIKSINHFFIECISIRVARGASYIPTPSPYNNSKCGLINIRNEDQECFKWCMKYHQSPMDKHSDRTTVLIKLDDKYVYDDVNFPADFDDVEQFEINNKVSVFVYCIGDDGKNIVKEKMW